MTNEEKKIIIKASILAVDNMRSKGSSHVVVCNKLITWSEILSGLCEMYEESEEEE